MWCSVRSIRGRRANSKWKIRGRLKASSQSEFSERRKSMRRSWEAAGYTPLAFVEGQSFLGISRWSLEVRNKANRPPTTFSPLRIKAPNSSVSWFLSSCTFQQYLSHHALSIMEGQNQVDASRGSITCLHLRQLSPPLGFQPTACPQGATILHHLHSVST